MEDTFAKNCSFSKPAAEDNGFIKTLNNFGYMTSGLDAYMQAFVEYAPLSSKQVLDIGAAYGVATIPTLQSGAHVIANDLDERHLQILKKNLNDDERKRLTTMAGDFRNLEIAPGSIGAILVARILHFLDGESIEEAVSKFKRWLAPGGKVFLTAETPYLNNWTKFIPEYEQRVSEGMKWPGLVKNVEDYITCRGADLPALLHFLDPAVLSRVFEAADFVVEKTAMFARPAFPADMQLDGRESVGLIARKP